MTNGIGFADVEKIANAVLYEGYMLYPYRSSAIKNQQRWNFGTLYPADFAAIQRPAEASSMVTECLAKVSATAKLEVRVRFLLLAQRSGGSTNWEEGFEKSVDFEVGLDEVIAQPRSFDLRFAEQRSTDECDANAYYLQQSLSGSLHLSAEILPSGACKLHFQLENHTVLDSAAAYTRAEAMRRAFVSAHLLMGTSDGEFVSLLDTPDEFSEAAAGCRNVGAFPVLVGPAGERTRMLSSPIILYDYPQVAPESAGDFFDGTEMDEMLALRVMTLTDDEKEEMRLGDSRARAILERTEALPQEHMMKVHGAIRGMRKVAELEAEMEGGR
ncbi:MAG: hypothetical protein ABI383_13420 [Acidobacteriaceae bacterium]